MGKVEAVIAESFESYIGWFVAQVVLDALFPQVALLINIGFVIFTIYGLLTGVKETLKAPTIAVFILSILSLAVNVWLLMNVS